MHMLQDRAHGGTVEQPGDVVELGQLEQPQAQPCLLQDAGAHVGEQAEGFEADALEVGRVVSLYTQATLYERLAVLDGETQELLACLWAGLALQGVYHRLRAVSRIQRRVDGTGAVNR